MENRINDLVTIRAISGLTEIDGGEGRDSFRVNYLADGDTQTYTIVGEHEADIKKRRISLSAPVARALLGKRVGDEVEVQTPKGKREVEVAKVEWLAVPSIDADDAAV